MYLIVRVVVSVFVGTLGDEMTRFGDDGKGSKKKRKGGGAGADKKHKKRRFK